jgi:hypothetical protein
MNSAWVNSDISGCHLLSDFCPTDNLVKIEYDHVLIITQNVLKNKV